jgi:putative ABC transport system permease protein
MFSDLMVRLRALLRRNAIETELDDELRAHFERQVHKNIAAGLPPEEARRRARLEFGGLDQIKEECRDARGVSFIETAFQDLRYGLRMLRKNPGFTAVAIITLALGIGANTAIFSVVNAVLLHPYRYPDPSRIVFVHSVPVFHPVPKPQFHLEFNEGFLRARSFENTAIYETGEVNLAGADRPERARAAEVTSGFFLLLGIPVEGRSFLGEEETPGRDRVAVISYDLCRRFGAPVDVLGRTIAVNGEPLTLVGVMPADFGFPGHTEIWLPLPIPWTFEADRIRAQTLFFNPLARLKPGVTLAQARDEMIAVASAPPGNPQQAREAVQVTPLPDALVGNDRPVLLLLLAAVALVLLIACADVANLLLTRAVLRRRETAVRAALGAGRGRLLRQHLTESVLLSSMGGGLGLLLAGWALPALRLLVPPSLPFADQIQLDGRVLVVALGLSIASGVVFGTLPALHAFRVDLSQSLKEGGVGGESRGPLRGGGARSVLAVSEITLALVLLAGAGLLLKSFYHLSDVDLGFNPERLMTTRLSLAESLYRTSARRVDFYQDVLRRASALPGVRSAAFTSGLPLSGSPWSEIALRAKEKNPAAPSSPEGRGALYSQVSPDYFRAMGIPLLAGRFFDDADGAGAPKVAIVSESLARTFWPGESPLGKHLSFDVEKLEWLEVVGVVGEAKRSSLAENRSQAIYLPLWQSASPGVSLLVRTAGDPTLMVSALRQAVAQVDRNEPLSEFLTMDQRISRSLAPQRFRTALLAIFAGLALVLGGAGIYGVMSYWAAQRTHEIGVRLALGARPRDALSLVLGQGLRLAVAGVVLGLAGSLAFSRLLANLLYGVSAFDVPTFAAVSVLLVGVALLASYIPARRATRVDPMMALRCE